MSRLYPRNRDLSQPLDRVELRVEKADEGRLDLFLAKRLRWRSRAGVQALIEEGRAVVNGEPLPWDEIAIAAIGALVLAALSLWWVRSRLEQFRQRGYVTRYS